MNPPRSSRPISRLSPMAGRSDSRVSRFPSRSLRWLLSQSSPPRRRSAPGDRNGRRRLLARPLPSLPSIRREADVKNLFTTGLQSVTRGHPEARREPVRHWPVGSPKTTRGCEAWSASAKREAIRARQMTKFRDQADDLLSNGEPLRFSLLGFSGDSLAACRDVERAHDELLGARRSAVDQPAALCRCSIRIGELV